MAEHRTRTLIPDQSPVLVLRDAEGKEMARFPVPRAAPLVREKQPGMFVSSLKRGTLNTASDFATTSGLVAEWLGSDEYAQGFYTKADEYAKRAGKFTPTIGRIENIEGIGDMATFAFETLIENAPMLASMAIPGMLVAKGAVAVGASTKAASAAGTAAAFLSNVGIQTGESGSIAREEGVTPADIRVVGSGLGKAVLDFVPVIALARRFGLTKNLPIGGKLERLLVGRMAEGGYLRRAAGHSGAIVAREIPTEIAQEYINISLQRLFTEHQGDLTEDEWSQMFNAAAGAAAFGLLGIPAGIRRNPPSDTKLPDEGTPEGVEVVPDFVGPPDLPLLTDAVPGTGPAFVGPPAPTPEAQVESETVAGIPDDEAKLPVLEELPTEGDQRDQARQAIVGEVELPEQKDFFVDSDGAVLAPTVRDPIEDTEPGTDPISQALTRTKEMVEVAKHYPQYLDMDPSTPEAQNIAALHPGLQRAYTARDELVADEDNYRSTDGQMKKAAETRLGKIDKRIEVLQSRLNVPARVNNEALELTPKEAQDPDKTVEPEPKLTEGQTTRLERLSVKEEEEGLTDEEYDAFVELQAIATGEIKAERQTQSQEQLSEMRDLEKEGTKQRDAETLASKKRDDEGTFGSTSGSAKGNYKMGVEGTGITVESAAKWINVWAAKLQFGPKVRIYKYKHPTAQAKTRKFGRKTYGWWSMSEPGVINLIADNHHDVKDLLRTYLHETLAHYGLRTMLSSKEMNHLMASLVTDPPPGMNGALIGRLLEKGDIFEATSLAEEYIAARAEQIIFNPNTGLVQHSWWKRLIAAVRRALRAINPKLKWTNNDIHGLLRNVSIGLSGRITPRYSPVDAGPFGAEIFARMAGEGRSDIPGKASSGIDNLLTVYGARFNKLFMTPLQFAAKYEVPGAQEFLETVQQWWARKRVLTNDATILGGSILKLDKRSQNKLAEAVFKISIKSDFLQRKLNDVELKAMFKELGMENDTALQQMWKDMDKTFVDVIGQFRIGLEKLAIRVQGRKKKLDRQQTKIMHNQYTASRHGTPAMRQEFMNKIGISSWLRLKEIDEEIGQLENRNYFPRMRFGTRVITIRARKDLQFEGQNYKGPSGETRGQVVYFEAFENDRALQAAFKDLEKSFSKTSYEMQAGELTDQEFHFMGVMSPQLYEKLLGAIPSPTNEEEGDMSDRMKKAMREVYLHQSPGRSFLRHLVARRGIAGYSTDMLRVYSSYMMNVANHIARVEYHIDMKETLDIVDEQAATVVPDARVEGIVRNYFRDQYNYLMNPENDWARARSLGFLWYLGFNVKSAMVNLTQVPMVAYPYLASQYGDIKSSAAILKALKLVTSEKLGGKVLSKELRDAIDLGVREGFIDESRATELAALGENNVLQRMMPETASGRIQGKAAYYGAWLFQHAERYNREVTFIAAYNLAKDNGVQNPAEAFKLGRKAVQTAMFEYAKWNRPVFMRGKKSVFFLFWQFMQGMSYLAFGGAGGGAAMRLWMMLLLAGGLQGLPFAENILDLLDFTGTKAKGYLGMKNPRVDLRNDLREFVGELTDSPDMVMHGLSRYYGAGPLHLLNIIDIPVHVDTSGSLSAGRVIPGTDEFGTTSRDPNAQLGRFMVDAFGPVAGMGYQFWRAAMDDNPDTWKTWERAMPSAMKAMSSSLRRGYKGEETFRGGGTVAEFDPQNTAHRAELLAQFFGFATTRVNQRYEADFSIERTKKYWVIRRALVMENVAYARMGGDREAIADSQQAFRDFNASVPDPALRIDGDQLRRSLRQRFRRKSLRERGIPSELLYRRLVRSMRELYPETEVEIERLSRR